MTNQNHLREALKFVLKWEVGDKPNGGYTNDPDDPGGETKWGIAARYHPGVDIKNLAPEQALDIYVKEYWNPMGCDDIGYPLNVVVFDTAVNAGVSRCRKWLRESKRPEEFWQNTKDWYEQLVRENPSKQKYYNGWMNRLTDRKRFLDQYKDSKDYRVWG